MARFSLLAIVLFISFFRLGSVTLFDVDEAVFSEATKEMLENGDWITPTYNGENRYDKPVLFYWLMAASYKLFGINEFGARFPSALSGSLLCLAVFFFVIRLYGEKRAFYAVLSLALSLYFLVYSHAAVTDMALTFFIALSLFSFYLSLVHWKNTDRYLLGFYLFSALAFLTKGLVGILFPFGIAMVYLLVTEGPKGLKRAFSAKGIILFLLISAPWYIAQLAINGQDFFEQFFVKHHFKRYTGVISGHKGPIYYYIPALIIGLLPWIAFLPAGIRNAFGGSNEPEVTSEAKRIGPFFSRYSSPDFFALLWFAFMFVFFSFSTTKLPNYILPAIPAASILIASGMAGQDRWRSYANAGIAAIMLLMGIAFMVSERHLLKLGVSDTEWIYCIAAVSFALAVTGLYAFISKKTLYGATAVIMGIFLLLLSVKVMPLAGRILQGTLHKYSLYAKERLGKDERILTYGINNPSIVFYSGHRVVRVGNMDELASLIEDKKRLLLISKAKETEGLKQLGFTLLEEDGKYALLERK